MKSTFGIAVLATGLLASGCVSYKRAVVLDSVGPPLPYSAAAVSQGVLVVFSAFETTADFNGNPYRRQYTDYEILSKDGQQVLKRVHNDKGILAEGPSKVELPAGNYRVRARANGYGEVIVPVQVCGGQVTTVHLEGSAWWPNPTEIAKSNPVRLPGGEIAGWRATGQINP